MIKKLLKITTVLSITALLAAGCGNDYEDDYSKKISFKEISLKSFDGKGSHITVEAYQEFSIKVTVFPRGNITSADIYVYLIDKESKRKRKEHIETYHLSEISRISKRHFKIYTNAPRSPGEYQVVLCATNIHEEGGANDRDILTREQCSLSNKKFDNLSLEVYEYQY